MEERTGVHGIVQNSMVKFKKLEEHGNAILRRYISHLFKKLKENSTLQRFNHYFKGWLPGNYNGKISCHSTWSKDGSYTKAKALQAGRK